MFGIRDHSRSELARRGGFDPPVAACFHPVKKSAVETNDAQDVRQ
jgi:hypothetical protein